jgi:hypothetical protein
MTTYEYRVIPAPTKGRKAQGVKGADARFAHTLQEVMNEQAAEGWDYQRSDILPSEERQGLTSSHTVYRSVLVFRRAVAAPTDTQETQAATSDETAESDDVSETYIDPTDPSDAADTLIDRS